MLVEEGRVAAQAAPGWGRRVGTIPAVGVGVGSILDVRDGGNVGVDALIDAVHVLRKEGGGGVGELAGVFWGVYGWHGPRIGEWGFGL